jgi:endogenous inhibitor of DNA gyrase (YacG/DUF329 family)
MKSPRCPTCKRDALPRAQNPSFPFCSPRCRAVDLGKWIGEEYRVHDKQPELEEDGLPGIVGDGTTEEPN